MKDLQGKVAAITGAGSGIGQMLAKNLAGQGCHVALADINEAGLKETADMLSGVKVSTHVVDVSQRDQVSRFAEEVVNEHGHVQILINNAGVSLSETLEDVTYEDFEWIMGINLWGVIYGCKSFLPFLRREAEAHIVNVSSVFGIFTYPTNGTYCTTKFAVRGFTETLCQELKGTRVTVSCVHPGGIRTNIVRNARYYKSPLPEVSRDEAAAVFEKFIAHTSADKASRIIIDGIRKNRHRIMVGPDAYVFDWLKRIMPVSFQKLTAHNRAPGFLLKRFRG
ncbi:SDR family oxidoreductase [archaeon]|nr:SDR family oxidoreductase [archaeon]